MTKFEAIRAITGVKEFSNLIYDLVEKAGSPDKLEEELMKELPDEAIATLRKVEARRNYPLSLDGIQ